MRRVAAIQIAVVSLVPDALTRLAWTGALAACEPDVRYVSSKLTTHRDLVRPGFAATLVPELAHCGVIPSLIVSRPSGRPSCDFFFAVRRGTSQHPAVLAFVDALRS